MTTRIPCAVCFSWGTYRGTLHECGSDGEPRRTDALPRSTAVESPIAPARSLEPQAEPPPKRAERGPLVAKLALLEREIAILRADRSMMTNDAVDDRLAQIHARVKAELR